MVQPGSLGGPPHRQRHRGSDPGARCLRALRRQSGQRTRQFTTSWRDNFGWFTKDLFTTTNPKFGEAINDALAAVIYVVLGNLISKLIVRLAPADKPRARADS